MTDPNPADVCCDHCGLPLASGWFGWRAKADIPAAEAGPQYCCSGCRLAAEIASTQPDAAATAMLTRLGFAAFLSMNVMCFTLALWSGDVYADGDPAQSHVGGLLADLFRWFTLILSWPVFYLLAGPIARNAWQQLRRGVLAVDLLLVLGVVAAFAYSTISVIRGAGHIYFEVGCVVLVFVTLGRWLETTGKQQVLAALDALADLLPKTVRRVESLDWPTETIVPLAEVARGDLLRVLPGERIPTDALVKRGQAAIDEQLVTGESQPAIKEPGDLLYGGTLNLDGQLLIETTAAANEGTLERLVEAVRTARRTKGRYQRLADRVSAVFLPLAVTIAVAAFAFHVYRTSWEAGFLAGMAVLLIACPCALGLATPLAIWASLAAAAKQQILFRHGEALERLSGIRAIFFDKTGTLSTGSARVSQFWVIDEADAAEVHAVAGALAAGSSHPLAKAVERYVGAACRAAPLMAVAVDAPAWVVPPGRRDVQVTSVAGRGLQGSLPNGNTVWLGSEQWMHELGLQLPPQLPAWLQAANCHSAALVFVAWQGRVRGVYACDDALRPEAAAVVEQLQRMDIKPAVLSGDRPARVAHVARQLGLQAQGGLLPDQKVAQLRQAKQLYGKIAMVGDGINDAPALATADVGIALACGADVSRDAADVCLLSSHLQQVPQAIELARKTVRTIRQNLFWAFAYNVIGVALAATGHLNPMWAAAAMTVSSVLVVSNSLRLGASENQIGR